MNGNGAFLKKTRFSRVLAYGAASAGAGVLYMATLYLARTVAGLSPFPAVTVAYAVAMAAYFVVTKTIVFDAGHSARSGREVLQFTVVVTINYVLTQGIVQGIFRLTGEVYSGSILAGAVTITLSYVVFERVVFKK